MGIFFKAVPLSWRPEVLQHVCKSCQIANDSCTNERLEDLWPKLVLLNFLGFPFIFSASCTFFSLVHTFIVSWMCIMDVHILPFFFWKIKSCCCDEPYANVLSMYDEISWMPMCVKLWVICMRVCGVCAMLEWLFLFLSPIPILFALNFLI